ncbi:sorting nexin-2-like isoform X3 [Eriocheir sinensis]|uniref:sorting nexin-2-like isoform X3 n=1 Tax=Eriocheir sinensis TaxID=95602 RepID=UPI0021C8010B|nr:sorting nexin-2-like isoform X3 [Eriocheir sinensis]
MADFREPPPLFNDDREDENDDLFSSAVQSPVSDKTATPEDQRPSEDPLTPHNSTASLTPADTPDLFESAQGPIAEGGGPDLPPASDGGDDKHQTKIFPTPLQEVPLEEEADEPDIFDTMSSPKLQLNQDTSEPPLPPSSILPPMGAPLTPPVVPVTPTATPSLTPNITPAAPTPVTPVAMPRTTPEQPQAEGDGTEEYIQITVSDPQKIGEGMSSYMAYKVTTKTNVSYFRKKHWSVMRRFSDFLGLHRKLVEKHLHSGRIIPPAPEKSAIGTTKIKLGSDKNADPGSAEFIERRRASLERYMNRTGAHPTLRADPDFREFIELDAELPRATQTSALSSAGVLRLFNRVGETVNKMTFKMDESDQWFEEKTQQIESLDAQLRKLHAAMEGLVSYRRELAISTASFAKATAVLSSVEEHSSLSRALHQLSESTERTHTIHHAQADADFYVLSENTKDYIHLIQSVKDVFHERVKTFQTWQHAQITLAKKREAKAKAELAGRMDKVQQAQEEVAEWEGKVERSQEEFERISRAIKKEMEQFDVMRLKDFRDMVVKYLEDLMTSQQQIIKVWETFIPEAKAIS